MRGLLFVTVFISHFVMGQYQSIKLEGPDGGSSSFQTPSIAIDPKDGARIVVALADKVYTTSDSGRVWKTVDMTSPHGINGETIILSDKKGDLYFFHLSGQMKAGKVDISTATKIVVQKSKDGGLTWEEAGFIGESGDSKIARFSAGWDPKTKNLVVLWTRLDKYPSDNPKDPSAINISWSGDGKKWEETLTLNNEPGDCSMGKNTLLGSLSVGVGGKLFACWRNGNQILLDRSYDKGSMWLRNDIKVSDEMDQEGSIAGVSEGLVIPATSADRSEYRFSGMLYVLWNDHRNGENDSDIWVIRSGNGGDTWTSPMRVNDDEEGKQQFGGSVTVDQNRGIVYASWYDRRNSEDENTEVWLAWSLDGGARFKHFKLSDTGFVLPPNTHVDNKVGIAVDNGLICSSWFALENGKPVLKTVVIKQSDLPQK